MNGIHLLRITTREPLNFVERHFGRVTGDAAFGTAVRQACEGAFPTHPHRQGRNFTERHIRVITQSALRGIQREVMLHPIAAEDPGRTVVHVDGQGDGQGAFRKLEPLTLADRNLKMIRYQIKLPASHLESRVCVNFHSRPIQPDSAWSHKRQQSQLWLILRSVQTARTNYWRWHFQIPATLVGRSMIFDIRSALGFMARSKIHWWFIHLYNLAVAGRPLASIVTRQGCVATAHLILPVKAPSPFCLLRQPVFALETWPASAKKFRCRCRVPPPARAWSSAVQL